ncbi:LuxR C-terminal-related transcriptional regulator [Streptomyces sp. G-G2]|uniref:LuxR C-terminal-related transcriptional regulator n=1 Tax=Streptomyces sp. G-G2 TaxID=3046201 RepID=UPI0024B8B45F|nr:LuxR C-terminal-related transcriptional regulator [Streptomyces sp. G-G2]MDJ0386092.1 LuxR C-terminal-related transcriptional regulator [Streptomyces sp. G-G2]
MQQAQVEAARAAIAAIAADHQLEQSGDGTVVLQGIDAVRSRLEELQRSAQFECLSLNPGGAHRPDARDVAAPLNEEALRRGVAIRAICRDSFRNDSDTLAYVRWLTERGGQMRTVPIVPLQMVVVDRKTAVLPLNPKQPRDGALEVRSPGVVALAQALFEQLWNAATPFGESAQEDDHGLNPMERQLLEIITAGETDEVAARALSVSLRTIRRMMASLMDRLEATSRFQAGVQATKRGWI